MSIEVKDGDLFRVTRYDDTRGLWIVMADHDVQRTDARGFYATIEVQLEGADSWASMYLEFDSTGDRFERVTIDTLTDREVAALAAATLSDNIYQMEGYNGT